MTDLPSTPDWHGRRQAASPMRQLVRRIMRFGRQDKGAAAVEFALVAPPFFALLFAILETAFMFFAGQILETGVYTASRMIRTGQAQGSGFSAADFREEVCGNLFGIIDCGEDGLILDIRTQETFESADLGQPYDEDGNLAFTPQYNHGERNDIVVVRAFVKWPVFVPGLGNDLSSFSDGTRLLAATTAFRNEPF